MGNYRFCSKCQKFVPNDNCTGPDQCIGDNKESRLNDYCKVLNTSSTRASRSSKLKSNNEENSK